MLTVVAPGQGSQKPGMLTPWLELAHLAALNLDTWDLLLVPNCEPAYTVGKR